MIQELVDLAFPAICLACGKKPKPLCTSCIPEFGISESAEGTFFAAELDEGLLAIISALKDKNRTALIPILGTGVAPCIERAVEQTRPTILVCPPSSKKNFRKRGFNPATEIFKFAKPGSLRLSDQALRLVSQTTDQRLLSAKARASNVRDRFVSTLSGQRVLLVDDVMTTGATLDAATLAIESGGSEVVGKCVVARRFVFSSHGNHK